MNRALDVGVLRAVRSATKLAPATVAAGLAVGVIIASAIADQADPTFALMAAMVLSTNAIGFTLDDDASVTLAASPTTLRRRRSLAAVLGCLPILAAWCVALVVVPIAWPDHGIDVFGLVEEVVALAMLTMAMGARWGGAAASISTPAVAVAMSVLATRVKGLPSLLVDSDWHHHWWLVSLAALVWLRHELRDPAAQRWRTQTVGRVTRHAGQIVCQITTNHDPGRR